MTRASPQRRYRLLIGGVSVLLVLALSAVAMLQWRQQRLLDATVRYQDDYLQVSLAQLQVEYLRLRAALARTVEAPQPDRDAVQLRYDIFVSRVDLLKSGRAERLVGDAAEFRAVVAQAGAFIDEADKVLGPQPQREALHQPRRLPAGPLARNGARRFRFPAALRGASPSADPARSLRCHGPGGSGLLPPRCSVPQAHLVTLSCASR